MSAREITEETLREWIDGFRVSRVLLTAVELGVFRELRRGAGAGELAARIGAKERSTGKLLDALTALGLLEKQASVYRPTLEAQKFLDPDSPDYMANLGHVSNLWRTWSRLTDVVRQGKPVETDRGPTEQATADFIGAMQYHASRRAAGVASLLDLEGVSRILDVGGGSGAFAVELVRCAGPEASGIVFDLPAVTSLTRKYLALAEMSDRIGTESGDYNRDPFPQGFDLVFMSSIVHINSPQQNAALIAKGAAALNPGGQLVVREFLMNEDRTGPLHAALFALNMLVNTPEGDAYTESEIRAWMNQAGLLDIRCTEADGGASLLTGRRPAKR